MTILINEEKVDFTLESEQKAIHIYEAVNSWLKETNHMIHSFSIDGIETAYSGEQWKMKNAKEIDKIEFTAFSDKEFILSGLSTVLEYFNLLVKGLENNSADLLNELLVEYPYICKNISILLSGNQKEIILSHVEEVMCKSGLLDDGLKIEYKEILINEILKICELISSASRELETPITELTATIECIKQIIPDLNDISLLLQTGKDQKAMKLIITLTELLQKILRILSMNNTDNIKIEGESIDSFSIKLNEILNELADAFDAKDSVLIGDLMEYEISPKLELLPEIIDSINITGA